MSQTAEKIGTSYLQERLSGASIIRSLLSVSALPIRGNAGALGDMNAHFGPSLEDTNHQDDDMV